MEKNSNNILTVLGILEKLETSMRDLYAWLSENFREEEQLHCLFRRMSREEETHAATVRYQKRVVHQNPDSFDEVSVNLDEIEEMISVVSGYLSKKPDLSPREAVQLALDLESFDEERLYRHVILDSFPEMAPLIQSLTTNDKEHVKLIEDFAGQYLKDRDPDA